MRKKTRDDYAISDFHFGDESILKVERTQFDTVEEHDKFILDNLRQWAIKAPPASTLWVLGDFGNTDMIEPFYDAIAAGNYIDTRIILGNHDSALDAYKFGEYFDEVYLYPQYFRQRIILSHEPQYPLPGGCINVHGHLHGAHLDDSRYISVSCNDIHYKPYKFSNLNGVLSRTEPYNMKFLWEPYAHEYVFNDKTRGDVVTNPKTGKIDLSASRALQKQLRDENWSLVHN